jgi:hypothetical protein
METKPTTKDVNTTDTTKGVKNADEDPAMNTRSKSKTIPGGHRVQPINGLASFVFKGLLSDSSHQDAHDGMCSHFDQLLTQPSKVPSNEGKGLNLTVVVGPYNTNNVGLNVTRTSTARTKDLLMQITTLSNVLLMAVRKERNLLGLHGGK